MIDPRFTTREVTDDQQAAITTVRFDASTLLHSIESQCPASRERSLAITKLEGCVMWAVKAITHGNE